MDLAEWGQPPRPRALTEAEVIREYGERRQRYASRRIPSVVGFAAVGAAAAFLAYTKLTLVRKHPPLLLILAVAFGKPILSQVFDALRYRPYCPACELGHGVRAGGRIVCSRCQARLS